MSEKISPVRGHLVFEAFRRTPYRAQSGPVRVRFIPAPDGAEAQVAYAIGRNVGKAVVRNRCRRRLRAVVAELADELPKGAYLISASVAVRDMEFSELRERMSRAMRSASGAR